MKRNLCFLLFLALCIAVGTAGAEGVTLYTASAFAGTDGGARAYVELLAEWEKATGNTVEDRSSASDEAWKAGVLNDFAAGNEPDILFFFADTSDSQPILDKVVPISEINAAYPGLNLPVSNLLREEDGEVYALSVRPFWEGLMVNVDLFEAYGLALPTDRAKLERAVAVFRENGIVPIAASLSDVPHYLAEISILACGSVEDHRARPQTIEEVPDSWIRGMELIRHLYEIGAFVDDVNSTSDDLTVAMFMTGDAAMLIDGSWRANGILQDRWNGTVVMPFPTYHEEADPTAIIGGTSMGFYLTRRVWADDARRDAAVDLFAYLTGEEAQRRLGFAYGGVLRESATEMFKRALENDTMNPPFQDVMDPDARTLWMRMIPAIAEGTADPRAMWAQVMEKGAF